MKSILVVDDNQINLTIAGHMLKGAYDVSSAASGEEALSLLDGKHFDLILLDVLMPGMDGFETLAKIREHDEWKDIPVIFLTADADDDTVERAEQNGVRGVVAKPFKKDVFLGKVSEVLA